VTSRRAMPSSCVRCAAVRVDAGRTQARQFFVGERGRTRGDRVTGVARSAQGADVEALARRVLQVRGGGPLPHGMHQGAGRRRARNEALEYMKQKEERKNGRKMQMEGRKDE